MNENTTSLMYISRVNLSTLSGHTLPTLRGAGPNNECHHDCLALSKSSFSPSDSSHFHTRRLIPSPDFPSSVRIAPIFISAFGSPQLRISASPAVFSSLSCFFCSFGFTVSSLRVLIFSSAFLFARRCWSSLRKWSHFHASTETSVTFEDRLISTQRWSC